jgi:hypothetical protein
MCDYSLHLAASRPAELAEIIEIKEFSGTRTRGFASPRTRGRLCAFVRARRSPLKKMPIFKVCCVDGPSETAWRVFGWSIWTCRTSIMMRWSLPMAGSFS